MTKQHRYVQIVVLSVITFIFSLLALHA